MKKILMIIGLTFIASLSAKIEIRKLTPPPTYQKKD